jgi:hypothetical protein
MPATQAEGRSAPKLTNGTRSPPRKRKQEQDDDFAVLSTPPKAAQRVKGETLRHLHGSPRLPNPSISKTQEKANKDLTSDSESESKEEQAPVATKKRRTAKSKPDNNGPLASDEIAAPASVKKTSRAKANVEVVESTATELKDESATPLKRKIKPKKNFIETVELEENGEVNGEATPKNIPRGRKTKVQRESEATSTEVIEEADSPSKKKTKTRTKANETVDLEEDKQVDAEVPNKTSRKRKTKEEREAEAMPLAARTGGLRMFIGAHVSIATGVEKAVTNCVHIGYSLLSNFLYTDVANNVQW